MKINIRWFYKTSSKYSNFWLKSDKNKDTFYLKIDMYFCVRSDLMGNLHPEHFHVDISLGIQFLDKHARTVKLFVFFIITVVGG